MNLLHEFFNSKSDANSEWGLLYADQQEQLENEFEKYQNSKNAESKILSAVDNMCVESLSPEIYSLWELIKDSLLKNRNIVAP